MKIKRGELDADAARDDAGDPAEAIVEHGLTLDVPEEYRSETEIETGGHRVDASTLDLPSEARTALDEAAEALLDGDAEAALAALDDVITTPCATREPRPIPSGTREVACHRYENGDVERIGGSDGGLNAAPAED